MASLWQHIAEDMGWNDAKTAFGKILAEDVWTAFIGHMPSPDANTVSRSRFGHEFREPDDGHVLAVGVGYAWRMFGEKFERTVLLITDGTHNWMASSDSQGDWTGKKFGVTDPFVDSLNTLMHARSSTDDGFQRAVRRFFDGDETHDADYSQFFRAKPWLCAYTSENGSDFSPVPFPTKASRSLSRVTDVSRSGPTRGSAPGNPTAPSSPNTSPRPTSRLHRASRRVPEARPVTKELANVRNCGGRQVYNLVKGDRDLASSIVRVVSKCANSATQYDPYDVYNGFLNAVEETPRYDPQLLRKKYPNFFRCSQVRFHKGRVFYVMMDACLKRLAAQAKKI